MKLSLTSWHARLYKLTYGQNAYLPTNLCPYFWKIVLSMIVFLPLTLICIPLFITVSILRVFNKDADNPIEDGYFNFGIAIALMLDAAIFTGFSMVYIWFDKWKRDEKGNYNPDVFQVFGIIGYMILIGISIRYLVLFIKDKKHEVWRKKTSEERYTYKEPEPNIFTEFIKAKYKKYCPKIEWKEK